MEESKDAHFPRKRLLHNSYILLSRLFSTAINQSFFFTRTPKHEVRKKTPHPKKIKIKRTTQQMVTRFQWRTSSTDWWAQFNSSNRHGTNYSTTETATASSPPQQTQFPSEFAAVTCVRSSWNKFCYFYDSRNTNPETQSIDWASERAKDGKKKEKRERREEAGTRPTRLISSYLPSKISKLGRYLVGT